MTVFESNEKKETKHYPHPIGECPICGKAAELIGNTGILSKEKISFETLCSNEYYRHVRTERHNDYCFKVNPIK